MAAVWTIAKDAIAFAGAVCVTLPWFFDFRDRVDLTRLKSVPTTMKALAAIVSAKEAWLAAPKLRDLALNGIGLIALCLSFLIALLQSLGIASA